MTRHDESSTIYDVEEREPVDAVEAAINEAKLESGLEWAEIAARAGMSVVTLHRYRRNLMRTPDSTRKIEKAFGWPRGYLDAIAAGEEPPPQPEPVAIFGDLSDADIDKMTNEELRAFVAEFRRRVIALEEAADKFLGRPETG